MIQCTACGAQIYSDSKFCEFCGVKQLTRTIRTEELQSLEQENRPVQFKLVILINYIVIGIIVVIAFIFLITPQTIYQQTIENGTAYVTITKSYTQGIIACIFFLVIAFSFIKINSRLKNYSYNARNGTIILYFFNLLLSIQGLNILSIVVSTFVIFTLLFNKELQDLWIEKIDEISYAKV